MNRKIPSWDDYFMAMAHLISTRSKDESTQVGAVIIKDNSIISAGYNSPPRGIEDDLVPQTRPEKYDWMIHAEDNAIANAARIGVSVKDAILYCTHRPCSRCMGAIINAGISKIYYENSSTTMTSGKEDIVTIMARQSDVPLVKYYPTETIFDIVYKLPLGT